MTMKTKDLQVGVSLLLQGYLRANGSVPAVPHEEDDNLAQGIKAMRGELSDWEENLEDKPELLAIARDVR